MAFLNTNSIGLQAINMITLHTNMHGYYAQADGIPQYIIMLEEAQKKAKQVGMPIADIELVMMALVAVLGVQHFPRKVNNWEGLPANSHSLAAWKIIPSRPPQAPASDLGLGGGSLFAGLTVCFLRRGQQSSGLKRHLTIWCSRPPTTRPCFSSSQLPTWPSRPPLVLSPRPKRNWWMQHLVRGDPWQGLWREGHGRQKLPSPATIVGRTTTISARSTRVQLAPTKPLATMLMPLLQIP